MKLFSTLITPIPIIVRSDIIADIISLIVIVSVAVALAKLYQSYSARQIIRAILPGIVILLTAALLKTANDIYLLPWTIRYPVMDAIISLGGIYVGITFIVLIKRLSISSDIDALTGCFNKDCFQNLLRVEIAHARRRHQDLSLLYIDIDNFKTVNDRMGHTAGDVLLRELAKTIQESVRSSDAVVRWGGDEFAAVLPDSGRAEVQEVVERINASVGAKFADFDGLSISVSIGLAIFPNDAQTPDELIKFADKEMYKVKNKKKAANNQKETPSGR